MATSQKSLAKDGLNKSGDAKRQNEALRLHFFAIGELFEQLSNSKQPSPGRQTNDRIV